MTKIQAQHRMISEIASLMKSYFELADCTKAQAFISMMMNVKSLNPKFGRHLIYTFSYNQWQKFQSGRWELPEEKGKYDIYDFAIDILAGRNNPPELAREVAQGVYLPFEQEKRQKARKKKR